MAVLAVVRMVAVPVPLGVPEAYAIVPETEQLGT
jgi:hypothetical protein